MKFRWTILVLLGVGIAGTGCTIPGDAEDVTTTYGDMTPPASGDTPVGGTTSEKPPTAASDEKKPWSPPDTREKSTPTKASYPKGEKV